MLQENQSVLRDELLQSVKPDESLCEQILNMGFDIELIRNALRDTTNDMQKAIENLLKMQADGSYENALKEVLQNVPSLENAINQPSTSASTAQRFQDREDELEVILILNIINYDHAFTNIILFRPTNGSLKVWKQKIIHIWICH